MFEKRLLPALLALASAGAAAGEALTPGAQSYAYCIECHGTGAAGNAVVGAPNLSVLAPWYLREALGAYRAGRRGIRSEDGYGAEMRPIATALEAPAGVDAAVRYIASLDRSRAGTTITGDAANGARLYRSCAGCHGTDGRGSAELHAPALAGQDDWYLVRELEAFREGWRGGESTDGAGARMGAASAALPDEAAIHDVVAYIGSLTTPVAAANETPAASAVEGARADGAASGAVAGAGAPDTDIVRYSLPGGSTFPIAEAVGVPAGASLLFHSGLTPQPANPAADPQSREYYGDTEAQTLSVLRRLQSSLASMGYSLRDVVKMTAFLVGDPEKGGAMDFAGFMKAYERFFGTPSSPNLPARSAVQVARLANPRVLVEIEVIAAKTP